MSFCFGGSQSVCFARMPVKNFPDRPATLRISVPLTDEELSALVSLSRDRNVSLAATMRVALREELSRAGVPLAGREIAS
jgi:hypothetical protein